MKEDYFRFGDGDFRIGGDRLPYSSSFDVVVHETAHAVTKHSSNLVYERDSGALNESFSDVMSASAEHDVFGGGDAKNFLIGERMYKSGAGLRNMADPPSMGHGDKGHASDMPLCDVPQCNGRLPGYNDCCGVHTNSGVPNRAFSLMTAGGKHAGSNVSVAQGIGWYEASALWYRTFTRLGPRSTFWEAAMAQISDVAKSKPHLLQAVACAWHAVGVLKSFDDTAFLPLRNMVCPEKASSCDGVTDGYVCNSQADFAAMRCKDGRFEHNMWCADISQRCTHAGADWAASLDDEGHLVCN